MTKLGLVVVVGALLVTGAEAKRPAPPPAPAPIDLAAVAERLVGVTANVKPNEIVMIEGPVEQAPLIEQLAIAVRKRGAHPLTSLMLSEAGHRQLYEVVPSKLDAQAPAAHLALAKVIDVKIVIDPGLDPAIAGSLPAERRATMEKAWRTVIDANEKHDVRVVEIGNDFTPTAWRARMFGISDGELYKMFWDGISADYSAIEINAAVMKAALARGSELRITHPNGTDFTVKIRGRKVLASDGVISDADIKARGANVRSWLPAGEVYVTPVPGTAHGTIVDDHMLFEGKHVTGVTVTVAAGKITAITANAGWDAAKPRYDAAGPRKNEIGVIDFGINPAVRGPANFESWVAAGTVTVTAGGNTWAGGSNKEPLVLDFKLRGATATLDGQPLVEAGTVSSLSSLRAN
ncbi:MAG: aminopeptidase [Kofleriaceae bacterium]